MKVYLVLFALVAFAYANLYDVEVKLGARFNQVENATMNLVVLDKFGQRSTFQIVSGNLTASKNYTTKLNLPNELKNITNTTFFWTSRASPKFLIRKPGIILEHIMIKDTVETARGTGRMGITKYIPFAENQTIGHKEEIKLMLKYHSE